MMQSQDRDLRSAQTVITNKVIHSRDTLALSRQNLFLGFPTKRDSNQSPQLQRLARKLQVRM